MKKHLRTKAAVFLVLSSLALTQTNCGIILHPERSGHTRGRVDVVTVVLDCVWLLLGIVPGLVALLIDVATGGLYEASLHLLHPGDPVGVRFHGPAPQAADVAITLHSPDGKVHTLASRHVEKGESMETAPVSLPDELVPGKYGIAISVNGHENARFHLQVE